MGSTLLFAQSVEQGKKFFYYERYKSAKEALESVLSANPNNIDAVYWLGQTLLAQKDSVGAKNLYKKLLEQNGNAPLVLVGMGQLELMEGKVNDARQRFEMAVTTTKGKDIDVLNAIGRANINAKKGDANYALEKLNLATQVKGFKDPETYILMGDAHRKLIQGGEAVQAYNKAFQLDNKLASAKHKIAKVYMTQNNPDFFLPAFEEAIAADPAYAPTYNELFIYWYNRNVNTAAANLEKYAANTDAGPEVEYLKTDMIWSKGDPAGAKAKAEQLIQQYGDKVKPRMYKMVAYAEDTLGNVAGAKKAMDTYFSKVDAEDVVPQDYVLLATIDSKTPGAESNAFANLEKAVALDTLAKNKVDYINKATALAKKLGNKAAVAKWSGIAYKVDPNPSQTDLYNWGYAEYSAGNYQTSDSIFCGVYQSKYPDQIYGYLWCARSKVALDDSTAPKGLAVDAYKLLAEKSLQIDSAKFKGQALTSYWYLIQYYNDVKKDKETALLYLNKVLEIDPTNETALKFKGIFEKQLKPGGSQPKPKTGNGSAAGGTGAKASSGS
ncbi:tetratricopeptide repeat protein [Pseudoflavitalea sp. G-6-1-2]|uniref:tetratricopeptide repeat protein n=1 Tax=Pseudoflavitalea sp. G-6-1-2 TaxID=2728841 RepID=UPI00146F4BD2|nr:tetratricopeptide repeat protein [Pseudoflavitalea sp. G-6-1-2]NML19294.1 tetratricopeptide repeat protein [Pseudoflavitalea sp. G-6-1-2]